MNEEELLLAYRGTRQQRQPRPARVSLPPIPYLPDPIERRCQCGVMVPLDRALCRYCQRSDELAAAGSAP